MGAVKNYHHDLIERQSRLYNVIELSKLEKYRLIEIASGLNIIIGEAQGNQTLIYAILDRQATAHSGVTNPGFAKETARNNHELWHDCRYCGYEYDLRRHSGVCPNCEIAKEKNQ